MCQRALVYKKLRGTRQWIQPSKSEAKRWRELNKLKGALLLGSQIIDAKFIFVNKFRLDITRRAKI